MARTNSPFAVLLLLFALSVQQPAWAVNMIMTPLSTQLDERRSISTSDQVSISLLSPKTPVQLWGTVKSDDINMVYQHTVATGNWSFGITVVDNLLGYEKELIIEIQSLNVGGSKAAAPDHSGTEALLTADDGRKCALVCPKNAGSVGCSVYLTGKDIPDVEVLNHDLRGRGVLGGPIPCTQNCGCFPGDATVHVASGQLKQMHQLGLGDKVAVSKKDGSIAYENIYAFGHKDAKAISKFVKITTSPVGIKKATTHVSRSLELTGRHFVPTSSGTGEEEIVYKRAQDIKIGDTMWALPENNNIHVWATALEASLVPYIVTDVSTVVKQGLYNPFTTAGTIVVNDALASVHSDWFLDGMFDLMGLTHFLPAAYQVVLTPPRMLFTVLGEKLYIATYTWLDERLNFIQLVADYSGEATSFSVACAIVAPLCLLLLPNNKKETQNV